MENASCRLNTGLIVIMAFIHTQAVGKLAGENHAAVQVKKKSIFAFHHFIFKILKKNLFLNPNSNIRSKHGNSKNLLSINLQLFFIVFFK